MTTICVRCKYYKAVPFKEGISDECLSPDTRYTDYVNGKKNPIVLNNGHCQHFERLADGKRFFK